MTAAPDEIHTFCRTCSKWWAGELSECESCGQKIIGNYSGIEHYVDAEFLKELKASHAAEINRLKKDLKNLENVLDYWKQQYARREKQISLLANYQSEKSLMEQEIYKLKEEIRFLIRYWDKDFDSTNAVIRFEKINEVYASDTKFCEYATK